MALTISGSGGGLTAPEVKALTGWNVVASFTANETKTWSTSGRGYIKKFSDYGTGVDLTQYHEYRIRAEITSFTRDTGSVSRIYISPGVYSSTNWSANPDFGYVLGCVESGAAITNKTFISPVFSITGTNGSYTFIKGIQTTSGTSLWTSSDVFDVCVYANGSCTFSYNATFYLEGRK